ncbi:MAG: D-sedoheptulose 7-phosphate isomerase [Ignavibacteriae bacterium]|nr:D-sedoheptulose 7-phosphate isomerase [Ignavibacteriota bacterium]MCB9208835.1 D-sedoheptulose 7-phosphate isomerase [Ignavibacteriales bacterium]MCB9218247.1 D-sedoheptulose 7-phosphate isomerase [Ignavibacteriales bacterium]MCB9260542.1 D-sedoheptulose 7-phosphate isomerase [Ignavibacteriales bacterium]
MKKTIENELFSHQEVIKSVINTLKSEIEEACSIVLETIVNGNKILLMGNGGSAADAQHIAAEFTGRYKIERKGLPAIAITTDTSALTAIGNDYGYNFVFERQVEALANKGDCLIGISSTGNSENVLRAFTKGKEIGCKTIGLSGKGGGKFNGNCDLNLIVPSNDTPRVQEMHILVGHIICQVVDNEYSKNEML